VLRVTFGDCRISTDTSGTDRLFTGQRLDTTGLYYYNARYYDPEIGRFISADTIVANPANPQYFNRYSYVLNNPLKYTDPSGMKVTAIGDTLKEAFKLTLMSMNFGKLANALDVVPEKELDVRIVFDSILEIGKTDPNVYNPDHGIMIRIRTGISDLPNILAVYIYHELIHADMMYNYPGREVTIWEELVCYQKSYQFALTYLTEKEMKDMDPTTLQLCQSFEGLDPNNPGDLQEARRRLHYQATGGHPENNSPYKYMDLWPGGEPNATETVWWDTYGNMYYY
jgi:RHS repeat-associated protein